MALSKSTQSFDRLSKTRDLSELHMTEPQPTSVPPRSEMTAHRRAAPQAGGGLSVTVFLPPSRSRPLAITGHC